MIISNDCEERRIFEEKGRQHGGSLPILTGFPPGMRPLQSYFSVQLPFFLRINGEICCEVSQITSKPRGKLGAESGSAQIASNRRRAPQRNLETALSFIRSKSGKIRYNALFFSI